MDGANKSQVLVCCDDAAAGDDLLPPLQEAGFHGRRIGVSESALGPAQLVLVAGKAAEVVTLCRR